MIPDQRHYSDPFLCHNNLLISESMVCFRRGSASLVEMLRCRTHSLTETVNRSPCLCPSQDVASANGTENTVHATDYLSSAQNTPLLSPLLPQNQHFHHDSASHFSSPFLPLNLRPPSELRLNIPHSPPSPQSQHHCKACMSLLLRDRTKGGISLERTHTRSRSASTQFTSASKPGSLTSSHQEKSLPVTAPLFMVSPSSSLSNSQPALVTSPSHLSSHSQVVLPWSLYEGADLTLLNHCLHHIVSRRTSSPTLPANHPMQSHGEVGGTTSSVAEHTEKRRSLDVPLLLSSPNLDRNVLLPSHDSEGRPDPLVG